MRGEVSLPNSDRQSYNVQLVYDSIILLQLTLYLIIFHRSYYRFYSDDWGIQAHTASLGIPIKVSPALTVLPFYRYHTQTAADYFAPFKAHSINETLYTSDYDLSALISHKIGLGVRIAPVYVRVKFFKRGFQKKYLELRGAYYTRDTGLMGYSGSYLFYSVIK